MQLSVLYEGHDGVGVQSIQTNLDYHDLSETHMSSVSHMFLI